MHVVAIELIAARVEGLQETGDVEEGGLAGAGGPGDRHELPGADLEGEAAQGVGLDEIGAVDLADVVHPEHRLGSLFLWRHAGTGAPGVFSLRWRIAAPRLNHACRRSRPCPRG